MKNKKIFFLFTALTIILLCFLLIIKNRKPISAYEEYPNTKFHFKKKLIDVGNKEVNSNVSATYIVYNDGKNDLYIKKIIPDCNCTLGEAPKDPIKPKDSASIVLNYDSSLEGDFQVSAIVETNSLERTTVLILRGNIIKAK